MEVPQDLVESILANAERLKSLSATASQGMVVKAGGDLQAALNTNKIVTLEDGATFQGNFTVPTGVTLLGGKATIAGAKNGAAVFCPPGSYGQKITLQNVTSEGDQAVLQVGTNDDKQTKLSDEPHDIYISAFVPIHRGKRAFYINGRDIVLEDIGCNDVYDPALRDSQGVLILNSSGNVTVRRGTLEAASENILVGGDVTAIPGLVPRSLLFDGITLQKRDTWRTDGVKRVVKNLFELKAGIDVTVRGALMSGSWKDGQSGYGIVLTPRNGCEVSGVRFLGNQLHNVGSGINILGQDDKAYSPQVHDVMFDDLQVFTAPGFGQSWFLFYQGEPYNITVQRSKFSGTSNTVYNDKGAAWDATTQTKRPGSGVTMGMKLLSNNLDMQGYGIMLNAAPFGKNWRTAWPDGQISGNTFNLGTAGSSANAQNLPGDNSFTRP